MTQAVPKLLTFDEFITRYGDNERYELIDGELIDMEPTGPHAFLLLLKSLSHHRFWQPNQQDLF
jgi:hypothetical protein